MMTRACSRLVGVTDLSLVLLAVSVTDVPPLRSRPRRGVHVRVAAMSTYMARIRTKKIVNVLPGRGCFF